jgi:arsenate reductase (glutaredoxin)
MTHAVTLFHNPACSNSRNVLALLRHAGIEPTVVEYLRTPPSKAALKALIADAGLGVRELLRDKEPAYAELGLGDPARTDDELLDAIVRHPVLMSRPVVVTERGTRLCRPPERVLALLPAGALPPFTKENGDVVHDSGERLG